MLPPHLLPAAPWHGWLLSTVLRPVLVEPGLRVAFFRLGYRASRWASSEQAEYQNTPKQAGIQTYQVRLGFAAWEKGNGTLRKNWRAATARGFDAGCLFPLRR